MVINGANISGGYFTLGTWIEDRLMANLHGMRTRAYELRALAEGQGGEDA